MGGHSAQQRQALGPHSDQVKSLRFEVMSPLFFSYCEGVIRMTDIQLLHGRGAYRGSTLQGQCPHG